uniref:Beta-defensin-like protein n=1 Tax=Lachesis muta TaxID=8752 RepID=M1JUV9_LACMT|nr:beta-defensin-like protein [Lachesis muta]
MKILYLLFPFLFLAFLSEPGNAQGQCHQQRGRCFLHQCPLSHYFLGRLDCGPGRRCCRRRK